jgi:integrase
MVTRKVSIWIRYKQEGDWVMKRAQWSANRRNLVPGMAKGARIAVGEYLYYLRYQRDGKRIMEPAGHDSVAAVARATTREIELFAAERGQQAPGAPVVPTNARATVAEAAEEYLRQTASKRRATYNAYRLALENFQEACPQCAYLDQVNVDTFRAFLNWMREEDEDGNDFDQNTIYARFSIVTTFLAKNDVTNSLPKGDRPKRRPVSKDGHDIETWDDEDIRKLLAVCRSEFDRLVVLVASETGMRRGEVAHLEREDILDGIIVVRARKDEYDFETKVHRGRNVGVPRWLTDKLHAYTDTLPACQTLLFPSEDGVPSGKALNGLMNWLCEKAGVRVPMTAGGLRQPFHGHRSYAAIKRLREGRSVPEVMQWLGWSDLATMMRYLMKARAVSAESRTALDSTKEPEPMNKETETDGKTA